MNKYQSIKQLHDEISQCTLCKEHLPFAPKPVYQVSPASKLLIIGQAPGLKVQQTGLPWNDASGKRLIEWLGITRETLYDLSKISIMPMGFCYPGKNKTGDLPPRKECAPAWHQQILSRLNIHLILLVGSYAQNYYLKDTKKSTLTETVRSWKTYQPLFVPLPHPSPLNNYWLQRNTWFEKNNLPELREMIAELIS